MWRNGDVFTLCPPVIPSEKKMKKFAIKNQFHESGLFVYALITTMCLFHVAITKTKQSAVNLMCYTWWYTVCWYNMYACLCHWRVSTIHSMSCCVSGNKELSLLSIRSCVIEIYLSNFIKERIYLFTEVFAKCRIQDILGSFNF